jgi:hypothetical protein
LSDFLECQFFSSDFKDIVPDVDKDAARAAADASGEHGYASNYGEI